MALHESAELYLRQLESAILHASSTGSPESSRLLDEERRRSSDGLAGACLELLHRRGWGGCGVGVETDGRGVGSHEATTATATATAQHDAVAFYALTTLQRSPLLSCLPSAGDDDDVVSSSSSSLRKRLRHVLLTTISIPSNLHSMPSFVATKVGVLLALLVREEYPHDWAQPWGEVLAALNNRMSSSSSSSPMDAKQNNTIVDFSSADGRASIWMYLSFLDAISDEIVYPAADDTTTTTDDNDGRGAVAAGHGRGERTRREQVKNALRGFDIDQSATSAPVEPSVPLEGTDVAHILAWLLSVLAATSQPQIDDNDDDADEILSIAVRAAATTRRYLSWIDLRLAADVNLVRALLEGLSGASPGIGGDVGEEPTRRTMLSVECAHCLRELADRGMDERKKLALLVGELDVFGVLCRLSRMEVGNDGAAAASTGGGRTHCGGGKLDLINDDGTQIEAVSAAAELINSAGLALIQGWELDLDRPSSSPSSPSSVIVQVGRCLKLALACLAYDSIDVSGAVVDLVSRILVSLEKRGAYWDYGGGLFDGVAPRSVVDDGDATAAATACDGIMSRILAILHLCMKYPPDFGFDYEDEEEAEDELYRAQLRKLYQRIVRLRPRIALVFVGRCLSSLPQPPSSAPTSDAEAALRLVYHYGEGRRPAPGARTALGDAAFRDMIAAIHRSDLSCHPHREVLLLYYDICVRYSDLLRESPELLSLFLGSLSGTRGLQHPHTRVRCRCCYLLLRLVKSVGAKAMRAHVEVVVDGIQHLLFPPAGTSEVLSIPPNEALYLFEATGILLGTTGLDAALQVRCATAVLTPHIRSIEQTLQSPDLARDDVETYGEILSMSISAIAQLSKGWQKHPPPEVQSVLAAAVDVCRKVVMALPSSPVVRNRTAVLLQRMILCLGEGILPAIPSFFAPLLSYCTLEEDVLDAAQLINQLCIKFKEKAVPAVDSSVLPFLQKVLAIQLAETTVSSGGGGDNSGISPPPHLVTEQLSIRKQAFATLQHIAVHNVSAVLYSETNAASLGDILQLMNDGAASVPDPIMNKTCASFFCELIHQWGRDEQRGSVLPTHFRNAFFDFVYGVYVPAMLGCILGTSFNVKDALQCRVLAEFCRGLWYLKQSCRGGAEFQSRVIELLVIGGGNGSGRRGSPEIVNGFQNAACGKDMEMVLKAWNIELKHR